jgi:hypothetical protein
MFIGLAPERRRCESILDTRWHESLTFVTLQVPVRVLPDFAMVRAIASGLNVLKTIAFVLQMVRESVHPLKSKPAIQVETIGKTTLAGTSPL